ncbi:MAG: DUF6514 family protein [Oscillospiraceae bacterium]|nr:DUF6514 family protein [Oscillospiraceae bacterium]
MEVKQKIETKVLRGTAGKVLRLDYCLLAQFDDLEKRLSGPYGMEIMLTEKEGMRQESCRNMTDDYRKAVALIHVFASNSVTPISMLELIRDVR